MKRVGMAFIQDRAQKETHADWLTLLVHSSIPWADKCLGRSVLDSGLMPSFSVRYFYSFYARCIYILIANTKMLPIHSSLSLLDVFVSHSLHTHGISNSSLIINSPCRLSMFTTFVYTIEMCMVQWDSFTKTSMSKFNLRVRPPTAVVDTRGWALVQVLIFSYIILVCQVNLEFFFILCK